MYMYIYIYLVTRIYCTYYLHMYIYICINAFLYIQLIGYLECVNDCASSVSHGWWRVVHFGERRTITGLDQK